MSNLALCAVTLVLLTTTGWAQTPVRLVDGPSEREGRLEVYFNNEWGTVCHDDFTDAAARVVCYMLGYGRVGRFLDYRHGRGKGPIWLDDVQCDGTETDIADCQHRPWGFHNYCDHLTDVSISCVTETVTNGTSENSTVSNAAEHLHSTSTVQSASSSTQQTTSTTKIESEKSTVSSSTTTEHLRSSSTVQPVTVQPVSPSTRQSTSKGNSSTEFRLSTATSTVYSSSATSTVPQQSEDNGDSDTTIIVAVVVVGVVVVVLIIVVGLVYLCRPRFRGNTPTPADSSTRPESHYELPSTIPCQPDEQHTYKSAASVAPEPPQPRDSQLYDSIDEPRDSEHYDSIDEARARDSQHHDGIDEYLTTS